MKKISKMTIAKKYRSISNPRLVPRNDIYKNLNSITKYKLIKNSPIANKFHLSSLHKLNNNKSTSRLYNDNKLPLIHNLSGVNIINNNDNNIFSVFNSEQKKNNSISKIESIQPRQLSQEYDISKTILRQTNNKPKIKYKLKTPIQLKNKNILNNHINGNVSMSSDKLQEDINFNNNEEKEIVKNYAYFSKAGKKENKIPKINQDSYLVNFQINNIKNFHMFGILDGHGENGHHASQLTVKFFKKFFNEDPDIKNTKDLIEIYDILKKDDYYKIKEGFLLAERNLSEHTHIDFNFSGTTCVIVFIIGKHIICANAGDSRAILFNKLDIKYNVIELSYDHKPNLPKEQLRIYNSGGDVLRYKQNGIECGPPRVWVKGQGYPGLAMSRSIGDLVATDVGVIPEPEIIEYHIQDNTKGIFIASDGIWEFITNLMVLNTFSNFYQINRNSRFCQYLVNQAVIKWKKEDCVIDDITCVSVFL